MQNPANTLIEGYTCSGWTYLECSTSFIGSVMSQESSFGDIQYVLVCSVTEEDKKETTGTVSSISLAANVPDHNHS